MKIKATRNISIPQFGVSFMSGEVKELPKEQAESLLRTKNFVADGKADEKKEDGVAEEKKTYRTREMTAEKREMTGKKRLSDL